MQVHRFGDAVGLSLAGKGETRYLSEAEARKLAKGLLAIADSIKHEEFAKSPDLTVRFETVEHPNQIAEPLPLREEG